MKIALCFLISYSHVVNKEQIWIDWIEPNKDIINVYFHYKNYSEIKSEWIKKHAIHPRCIVETDYMHVVPAYLALMSFAMNNDAQNQWFCFLTDSCAPIISPLKFRELFFENYSKTIMSWRNAWWNVKFCKRANLQLLKEEFHLANDPWFIMKREDVKKSIVYSNVNAHIFKTICSGDVANESIFAIMLHSFNELQNVKSSVTHITDWSRMTSATSPHVFKEGNPVDMKFITNSVDANRYAMFIRKVDKCFPDNKLLDIIYKPDEYEEKRRAKVTMLERKMFFLWLFNNIVSTFKRYGHFLIVLPFINFFLQLNTSFQPS
jgi:hypothetical protein